MKKRLLFVLIPLCVIVLLVGCYFGISFLFLSNENCVKNYLQAYQNKDFNSIKNLTNITGDEIINAKNYFDNEDDPCVGLQGYHIISYSKLDNRSYTVKVSLEYADSSKNMETTLKVRSKKSKIPFFKKWYVEKSILKDVEFQVLKDTKVYFDDMEIDHSFIKSQDFDGTIVTYHIPRVYNKRYHVRFEYPFADTQEVYWKPSSLSTYSITFEVDEELSKKLIDSSSLIASKAYENMDQLNSFEDFVHSLSYGDWEKYIINTMEGMKDRYESILDQQKRGENLFEQSYASDFEIEDVYMNPTGFIQVNLKYTYHNKYKDSASGYTCTSKIKIYFAYHDGQFKYYQIDYFNFH